MMHRALFCCLGLLLLLAPGPLQAASPAFDAPSDWPLETPIRRTQGQRQVLLFANPHAFETRTAIYQAIELSARSGASCTVCLVGPADAKKKWFDTPVAWTAAQNGLRIYQDAGGSEARRFFAENSGVCLAFDARGKLCFYGDLIRQDGDDTNDAGLDAALKALSYVHGNQGKLIVRPVSGKPLSKQ